MPDVPSPPPKVMKLSEQLPRGQYSQRTLESLAMYDESEVPLDVIIDLVRHIHTYEGEGAILIFLSGWEEISAVSNQVASRARGSWYHVARRCRHGR